MMTSMWFLMVIPFAFVAIGVLWYRQSMEAREKWFEEEGERYGRGEVRTR